MSIVIALVQAIVAGLPRLIELIKSGRSAKNIKLGDFISHDALADLEAAKDEAADFVNNG